MRVLFVVPAFQPAWQWGGTITADWSMVRGVAQAGVQITVATTDAVPDGRLQVPRERTEQGIKILPTGVFGGGRLRAANRFGISASHFALAVSMMPRFALIHFGAFWMPTWPPLFALCRLMGKPYVITPHGMLEEYSLSQKQGKKELFIKLFARRDLLGAAAIHFTAAQERQNAPACQQDAGNSVIVPNAVEIAHDGEGERFRQKIGASPEETVLGMVGRIHHKKGFDVILPAMGAAREGASPRRVVVGPDEGYKDQVEQMIAANGLAGRVTFTGMLKGQDLADAYAGLDALVLPSYEENFGMVVVEAVAQGTPAIISEPVGLRHWVAERGVGEVLPMEHQAWVEMLERVDREYIRASWQQKELREEARNRFSLASVGRQMVDAYERLV